MVTYAISPTYLLLENRSLTASQFHRDLCKHILAVCTDYRLAIDSPVSLDDQIWEWLGQSPRYLRPRVALGWSGRFRISPALASQSTIGDHKTHSIRIRLVYLLERNRYMPSGRT